MTATTHRVAGCLAGISTVQLLTTDPLLSSAYLVGVVIGSILPDFDTERSFISCKLVVTRFMMTVLLLPLKLLPEKITKGLTSHRGFTHSLLSLVPWFILAMVYRGGIVANLAAGIGTGIASHIIMDLISGGTMLLYPWKQRIRIASIKTGSVIESLIAIGMSVYVGWSIFSWIGGII